MREIRQWQAYDGTIFDDEEECRVYENEKLEIENEIIFYDNYNRIIDASFNKIHPEKVYGMIIKSKKAINVVRDYFFQYGSIIPVDFGKEEKGCWVWSEEETDWIKVEQAKQEIEEKLEDYNRMLKELENIKKIKNRG